jgi:hypothetical protein
MLLSQLSPEKKALSRILISSVKTPFLYYLFKTQLGGPVHKPIGGLSIHISSFEKKRKKAEYKPCYKNTHSACILKIL